jgi:hypothetical protein
MDSNEHEVAFVNSFVVPERRARVLELLSRPKSRQKQLDRLNHTPDLDPRFCAQIASGHQSNSEIERLLRDHGAPDEVYVFSSYPKFDRWCAPLNSAISKVVGFGFGSIISCLPGQLAYYEGESPRQRYILRRHAG